MIRVFLCGEGATELGGRAGDPAYRTDDPGVLDALLDQVLDDAFEVVDASVWKHGPSYVVGSARARQRGDAHNLQVAALRAYEADADLLVYVRDEDADPDRASAIEEGRAKAEGLFPTLKIAGGLAVQCTEAWLLAILGQRRTERLHRAVAKSELATQAATFSEKAELVSERGLGAVPEDARSLRTWIDDVRAAAGLATD